MRDIIDILERWTGEGASIALGSVVERIGSAPRDPGAALAVSAKHGVAGGVTGGCVEPAVIREAMEVLEGAPGRLVHYGLDDDDGFDVGLNCGGRIAVAVYRLDPAVVAPIAEAVRGGPADRARALARARPFRRAEDLLPGRRHERQRHDRLRLGGRSAAARGRRERDRADERGREGLHRVLRASPQLYLFGASDHVAALVPVGKQLGYRVTVCDPRTVFLTRERFPDADELSDEWPDQFLEHAPIDPRTAICMMTHDLKFDVPALQLALGSNAGFIGAIGSEKTRADRNARLRERGIGDADLARLHAPIGISIGARTPDEVAVSIAAQLIEANQLARAKRVDSIARATVLS